MKDFVIHGRCVETSAIQRIIHQVLLEKYGGPPWTYENLPIIVRDWLSAGGFNKAKILAHASGKGVSLANSIHSEMGRLGGMRGGSIRREMTIHKALSGGLFPIRGVKTVRTLGLTINFINIRIRVPYHFVTEGLLEIDEEVNVDFPIFELRNSNCYAEDALTIDPGYLVGIRMRGTDWDGKEWCRWLKASGDKAAKKANNLFDWLTNTGITQTEHKIPRRFYKHREGKKDEVEYT